MPSKYGMTCRDWARIGTMLAALAWLWPNYGLLCRIYRVMAVAVIYVWTTYYHKISYKFCQKSKFILQVKFLFHYVFLVYWDDVNSVAAVALVGKPPEQHQPQDWLLDQLFQCSIYGIFCGMWFFIYDVEMCNCWNAIKLIAGTRRVWVFSYLHSEDYNHCRLYSVRHREQQRDGLLTSWPLSSM